MVFVKMCDTVCEIRFKSYLGEEQFRIVVDRIKSIPGRKFHGEGNYWTIPCSERQTLEKLFTKKELIIEEEVIDASVSSRSIPDDVSYLDELLLQPYPFQVVGINFLQDVRCGILADEMGLGKTVEILTAIYRLYRSGTVKRSLIICPATLKYQWEEEIGKFFDTEQYGIDYIVIDGDVKERKAIYESLKDSNVLYIIINYELVRNDINILSQLDWDVIALDEAHRIKNWKSKTSEAIQKLDAAYKWAATGTPMQNRPEELYNIFKWINPKVLGDWWKFRGRYIIIGEKFKQKNMVLGYRNLGELHRKISLYMLRRLKKDVAPELPEMLVNNFYVEMTPGQVAIHSNLKTDLIDLLKEIGKFTQRNEDGEVISQHPKANQILGMFMMMQEVCDIPQLLKMSDAPMARKYCTGDLNPYSPKLHELVTVLSDFISNYEEDNPPKAVIFTQFERMQRLVVDAIKPLGKVRIVNGLMSAYEKQRNIVDFKTQDDVNFLVCTDSANYGVNLQEASLLVNVDLPWNPAVWDQRNARIHRLNSTYRSVNIVNLISIGGLDEKILETLYSKKDTASTIVENSEAEVKHLTTLTHDLMRKLLSTKKHKVRKGKDKD